MCSVCALHIWHTNNRVVWVLLRTPGEASLPCSLASVVSDKEQKRGTAMKIRASTWMSCLHHWQSGLKPFDLVMDGYCSHYHCKKKQMLVRLGATSSF